MTLPRYRLPYVSNCEAADGLYNLCSGIGGSVLQLKFSKKHLQHKRASLLSKFARSMEPVRSCIREHWRLCGVHLRAVARQFIMVTGGHLRLREVIGADHCPVRVKVASLLGDGILTFLSS